MYLECIVYHVLLIMYLILNYLRPMLQDTIYGKTFEGENFHGFAVFHSITNAFPQIMVLLIGNVNLQAC